MKIYLIIILAFMPTACFVKGLGKNFCSDEYVIDLPKNIRQFVFGEVHGNNESPKAFFNNVCKEAKNNNEIIVALELPVGMDSSLKEYIKLPGKIADPLSLLSDKFWQVKLENEPPSIPLRASADGRSSIAVLNLIENLRKLNSRFGNVSVVPIDGIFKNNIDLYDSLYSRDDIMASNLNFLYSDNDKAKIFALVGNFHSKKSSNNEMSLNPMASQLKNDYKNVYLMPIFGSSWNCGFDCGSNEFPLINVRTFLRMMNDIASYDLVISLGRSTASPPAITLIK